MNAYIVCRLDCRLARFLLWGPRWLVGTPHMEAVRVGPNTTDWVRISYPG